MPNDADHVDYAGVLVPDMVSIFESMDTLTNFLVTRTLSVTAEHVMQTQPISSVAEMTISCLNWVSPRAFPKNARRSTIPLPP